MSEAASAPLAEPRNTKDRKSEPPGPPEAWWAREDLCYKAGRLCLGDADLDALADKVGTPAYVLRPPRVLHNARRLKAALAGAGVDHRLYYAIKANRTPQLLSYLAAQREVGADICSPGELHHALACGFREEDISFTATSLAPSDFEALAKFDRLNINLDSLSALESFGQLCPGREIGIRINPDRGIGYAGNDMLQYSGVEVTKFGIYIDRLPEALEIAAKHGLTIKRVHFHAGSGYLDRELSQLSDVLAASRDFLAQLPDAVEVNIGGGLGVPHTPDDRPLDLEKWAMTVADAFAGSGLRVAVEPGDFLVKDAGVLLTRVTYEERRREVAFLGLDAGFNLAMEPAFYGLPCEPVPAVPRDAKTTRYTVVGNVNEALDKWAVDHAMPEPRPGDVVALINAGGYAAAMRSDHCMRGEAKEVLLLD